LIEQDELPDRWWCELQLDQPQNRDAKQQQPAGSQPVTAFAEAQPHDCRALCRPADGHPDARKLNRNRDGHQRERHRRKVQRLVASVCGQTDRNRTVPHRKSGGDWRRQVGVDRIDEQVRGTVGAETVEMERHNRREIELVGSAPKRLVVSQQMNDVNTTHGPEARR
jgi:hypothetical protein